MDKPVLKGNLVVLGGSYTAACAIELIQRLLDLSLSQVVIVDKNVKIFEKFVEKGSKYPLFAMRCF
jgi:hypothetical protein